MANLYTKTGDKGETGLYGGSRISKSSLRVECYGTVDEANSALGFAYTQSADPMVRENIQHIQRRLFSLGAELASDEEGREQLQHRITGQDVRDLEDLVDRCTEINGMQTTFVVPGVNAASAALHVARTVVRRAERCIIRLNESEPVSAELMKYVNRLSDAVYSLARTEETLAAGGNPDAGNRMERW